MNDFTFVSPITEMKSQLSWIPYKPCLVAMALTGEWDKCLPGLNKCIKDGKHPN